MAKKITLLTVSYIRLIRVSGPRQMTRLRRNYFRPAKQPLRMKLDTKHRSGKAVTLIEGFQGPDDELEKLGKQLKTYCGTGGSVKDRQVIIQGDQRAKVLEWLKKNGYSKIKN